MSRALLSQRLRELVEWGVIAHGSDGDYQLTEAGTELKPVIIAMGIWGRRWVESELHGPDWDAGVLMWDMRRRIDTDALPEGRTVLQFEYCDAPEEMRWWWLLIEDDSVDLCVSDPGFEVDLYVMTKVRVMGPIWIGQRALDPAIRKGDVVLHGRTELSRTIGDWLLLSVVAPSGKTDPPQLFAP
jgi:hypothetical protein